MGSIYAPAEDSFFLQKYVREYAFGRVLDMGTGSGIQALSAIEKTSVREVVAIDINEDAVDTLQRKVREGRLRKIKVISSDLFAKVPGKFNIIIFNPPYLPQDRDAQDVALYGGKKGWELSERFFQEVSSFLFPEGKILFLFSSWTNRKKIDSILQNHLFEFRLLEYRKLAFFEELYVYEIWKSPLLRKLEQKGMGQVEYFSRGKRGLIFTGILDRSKLVKTYFPLQKDAVKVAIKIPHKESGALGRISNEAKWLQVVNEQGIGPRYLFHDEKMVAYWFVEGVHFIDWTKDKPRTDIVKMLSRILQQCYQLDLLKVNKEEMHHPFKHIIITPLQEPVLLDFERCARTLHPQNVTQFVEFICKLITRIPTLKGAVQINLLRKAAKEYKDDIDKERFAVLIRLLTGGTP